MSELARRRRALMGNVGYDWRKTYTPVEWIESDGNQYILTSYTPNALTELTVNFIYLGSTTGNTFNAIFGEINGTSPNFNRFVAQVGATNSQSALSRGKTEGMVSNFITPNTRYNLTATPPNNWAVGENPVTFGDNNFSGATTLPWGIFGRNNAGTKDRLSRVRLFSFVAEENGKKMIDLIPCYRKADTVIGMYDTVSGTFYTNSGTGSFAKGADV